MRLKICFGKIPLLIVVLPSAFVATLPRPVVSSHFISCVGPSCAICTKKNFLPGSEEKVERRGYHEGCQEVDFHNFSDKWK